MSKEIKRMTYEERVKWHEEHLEEIFLAYWHNEIFLQYLGEPKESFEDIKSAIQFSKWGVERGANRFLHYRPHYEQNLHKEEWMGCDLTLVHELLRRNDFEKEVICLIKDKQIISIYQQRGAVFCVPKYDFTRFFKEAQEKGAAVYMVHNHPVSLVAIPSSNDVDSSLDCKAIADEFGVEFNWGVVADEDYWSNDQEEEKNPELLKEKIERTLDKAEEAGSSKKKLTYSEIVAKAKKVSKLPEIQKNKL